MKGLDKMPIACSLSAAELRNRQSTLLAQFRSAVIDSEEVEEGYAFRLSSDSESLRLVAEVIRAERECCPFLTFELAVLPNMGLVTLRVIGRAGQKQFLKDLLCKAGKST